MSLFEDIDKKQYTDSLKERVKASLKSKGPELLNEEHLEEMRADVYEPTISTRIERVE